MEDAKTGSELHQLLAIEGDLEGTAKKIIQEAENTFSNKQDHFTSELKRTEMFDESRKNEDQEEYRAITTTVREKLEYVEGSVARWLDVFLQKERTNQDARCDLVVNGVVVAKDVPATALLGLESRLKDLRRMYDSIPTLRPGIDWQPDESASKRGVYKNAKPEVRKKTEKTIRPIILAPATEKHAAQVEKLAVDVSVGTITIYSDSGMLSPGEKSVLLGRIDDIIRAVKQARMKANNTTVVKCEIGRAIFRYINGE